MDHCVQATLIDPNAVLHRADDGEREATPSASKCASTSALYCFTGQEFDRFLINGPQHDITSYCFF